MKIHEIIAEEQVTEIFGTLSKAAGSKLVQKAAGMGGKSAANLKQAAVDISTIIGAFGNAGKVISKVITSLGVATVFVKTYLNIRELNKKLESGQLSGAEYEKQLQAELGYAATQLMAAGVVKLAISGGGAIVRSMPMLGWPGRFIQWLSGPASAAFITWLQTSEGQEVFAKWFIGAIMAQGFTGAAIDFISSYTKKFYDMITMRGAQAEANLAKSGKDSSQAGAAEPESDDDFFKNLAAQKPKGGSEPQEFDPATGTWLNKPKS